MVVTTKDNLLWKLFTYPLSQAHALFTRDFLIILNWFMFANCMGGKSLEIDIKLFSFCIETFLQWHIYGCCNLSTFQDHLLWLMEQRSNKTLNWSHIWIKQRLYHIENKIYWSNWNRTKVDWESKWNNCFIIYTRSEFTDFAFRIFSIFFYFVWFFAFSVDYIFKNIYFLSFNHLKFFNLIIC